MNAFTRFFTTRWEIKGLSLLLAIALYSLTGTLITTTATVTVRLNESHIKNLPTGLEVSSLTPTEVRVTARGPQNLVDNFKNTIHDSPLNLPDGIRKGTTNVIVNEKLLGIKEGLVLIDKPEPIRLTLSARTRKRIPLGEMRVINVPTGMRATISSPYPRTLVELEGPEDILNQIQGDLVVDSIQCPDITATTVSGPIPMDQQVIRLAPLDPRIRQVSTLHATIWLEPIPIVMKTSPLPVLISAEASLYSSVSITVEPKDVILELTGPQAVLQESAKKWEEAIPVRVDFHPKELHSGVYELPLIAQLPPGVTAVKQTVKLHVRETAAPK